MATYSRQELNTIRVEFVVPAAPPWGAAWVEVTRAIRAAHVELWEAGVVPEGADASDDRIAIEPRDDEIVVSYERRITERRAQPTQTEETPHAE